MFKQTKLSILVAAAIITIGGCGGGGGGTSSSSGNGNSLETTSANNAPVITSNPTATVNENQNRAIDVDATDADGDTLFYSIEGGPDAASVVINSATGEVIFVVAPDFETKNSYRFTVGVSDGTALTTQDVTVTIADVAEGTAPVITTASDQYADENQKSAFTVTATDIDGDTITYSIEGGADASAFDINASSGVVTFKSEPDFETKNSYAVTVGASDATDTTTKDITIHINDLDGSSSVVQTGQTIKYVEGDDGDLQVGKTRNFEDTGSTVIDKATGLEWKDNTYIAMLNYADAVNYCGFIMLDQKDDWRLPTIDELYTITDRGAHDPAIFNVFDNTLSKMYWASDGDASDANKAYVLNFYDGTDFTVAKSEIKAVRCVRKADASATAYSRDLQLQPIDPIYIPVPHIPYPVIRFTKIGQIVSDHLTKLQWYDNHYVFNGLDIVPPKKKWNDAVSYCRTLSYNNKNDWRLPNINELLSITYKQAPTATKAPDIFDSLTPDIFWSATTTDRDPQKAWTVNFAYGQDVANNTENNKDKLHHVRCVRTMGD